MGVDLYDPATIVTYDEVDASYDSIALDYDSYDVRQFNRQVNVFSSAESYVPGSEVSANATRAFRFLSTQTSDDGTAIDARWRSPGLRSGDHHKMHLAEVWVDYETDSASSASIFFGDARSETFDDGRALNLTTSAAPLHVAAWKTDEAPHFEIRLNDGGRPRLTLFVATLKDASKF